MKKGIMIPLAALLALFIVAPVFATPATRTPFDAVASIVGVSEGKHWITNDGILHVKRSISKGTVTGEIAGEILVIEDSTLDLNTGEGSSHGKWIFRIDGGGTFERSYVYVISGYIHVSGKAVGHGTGVYEGKKMMFSFEGDAGDITIVDLEGIILSPKG